MPHVADAQLEDIVDLILKVNAGAYSIEAANVRHEHEWYVWQKVKLPPGKILIPGVVTHHTTTVEHPRLVAERIVTFAKLVGRENVIAGTDCGFAQAQDMQRVHPQVMWAKLEALAEGARRKPGIVGRAERTQRAARRRPQSQRSSRGRAAYWLSSVTPAIFTASAHSAMSSWRNFRELLGREADRRRAVLVELRDELRILRGPDELVRDAIDDRARRLHRRHHAVPAHAAETREAGLGDGRNVLRLRRGDRPTARACARRRSRHAAALPAAE